MQSKDDQKTYFLQYLSSAPVLAVGTVFGILAVFTVVLYYFPDTLFFTKP